MAFSCGNARSPCESLFKRPVSTWKRRGSAVTAITDYEQHHRLRAERSSADAIFWATRPARQELEPDKHCPHLAGCLARPRIPRGNAGPTRDERRAARAEEAVGSVVLPSQRRKAVSTWKRHRIRDSISPGSQLSGPRRQRFAGNRRRRVFRKGRKGCSVSARGAPVAGGFHVETRAVRSAGTGQKRRVSDICLCPKLVLARLRPRGCAGAARDQILRSDDDLAAMVGA